MTPIAPLRLVLDTNVVLDCTVFRDPASAPIVELLDAARAVALVRDDALEELRRVLAYPQFGLAEDGRERAYERYRGWTEPVRGCRASYALPLCRDRDDQKFLELARDGGASHLVTKDKALLVLARRGRLRARFEVMTPASFGAAARALAAAASGPTPPPMA